MNAPGFRLEPPRHRTCDRHRSRGAGQSGGSERLSPTGHQAQWLGHREPSLCGEDPYRNFLPSIGRLTRYRPPEEGRQENGTILRNDTGVFEGGEISCITTRCQLCSWGETRPLRYRCHGRGGVASRSKGIEHNLPFSLCGHAAFPVSVPEVWPQALLPRDFRRFFPEWSRRRKPLNTTGGDCCGDSSGARPRSAVSGTIGGISPRVGSGTGVVQLGKPGTGFPLVSTAIIP